MNQPKHGRQLVVGAVALVPGRVRFSIETMTEVRELVEATMIQSCFLSGAPFSWIGLILRYGEHEQESPEYETIDPENGELPVAIELDMTKLRYASQGEVRSQFLQATLRSVIDIGKKFNLPIDEFEKMLQEIDLS